MNETTDETSADAVPDRFAYEITWAGGDESLIFVATNVAGAIDAAAGYWLAYHRENVDPDADATEVLDSFLPDVTCVTLLGQVGGVSEA